MRRDKKKKFRRLLFKAILCSGAGLLLSGVYLPQKAEAAQKISVSAQTCQPISVLAAENFYGDIASQIGGQCVVVRSVLNSPAEVPNLFEPSPLVNEEAAKARLIILNGINYDPWMAAILSSLSSGNRVILNVAELAGKKNGDNPHLWYNPEIPVILAKKLAGTLAEEEPSETAYFKKNLQHFLKEMQPVFAKIKQMRTKFAKTPITATEPVADYLAEALGFKILNLKFQYAVMNNTEPGAAEQIAFIQSLKDHQVRLFIFNEQVRDPASDALLNIAKTQKIPIVGVTETEPPGLSYQVWMMQVLTKINQALEGKS